MKKKYDYIVEVEDTGSVKKFNPFHDARGRFASANSFASYSANPNTKAGAMAIARSAAAGHGNTLNVHRQSYGENIRQNANWLGRGKQANPRQQGNATLRQRVEPIAGLPGASATGASWQAQNAAQGRKTNPSKKPTQQQQKPAQQQKPQPTQQNPANQQTNGSLNGFKGSVTGKDISRNLKLNTSYNAAPAVQQVAKQQGFLGKPKLVNSQEFYSAATKSGVIGFRTWNDGTDVTSGKRVSAKQFKDDFSNKDNISLNGSGGQAYGGGIYIATTRNPQKGTLPKGSKVSDAVNDSLYYGRTGRRATAAVTLDPTAKVADGNTIRRKFFALSSSEMTRFGGDIAAYAAALGYDAVTWKNAGGNCDYTTVYNRTKLIVLDDPSNSAFGIRS